MTVFELVGEKEHVYNKQMFVYSEIHLSFEVSSKVSRAPFMIHLISVLKTVH